MKQYSAIVFSISSIILFGGWGSQETNIDSSGKPAINFKGTIITQNNQTLSVENILIGGMYDKIQVYDSTITPEMSRAKPCLTKDPSEGIGTTIGLETIYQIEVPEPEVLWYFEKHAEGARCSAKTVKPYDKIEYIEIVVISNNENKTTHRYLLDARKKIRCNEIKEANIKQIPFSAITQLTITEFAPRDASSSGRACVVEPRTTAQS